MGGDPMMLALDVEPMGVGDWRWRWYDHDSGATLADGVESGERSAWTAALTHYVERSDECVRALAARAEAAEAALAAARAEVAQASAHADRSLLIGMWLATVPPDVLPTLLPTDPGDLERLAAALEAVDLQSGTESHTAAVRAIIARIVAEMAGGAR